LTRYIYFCCIYNSWIHTPRTKVWICCL